MLKRTYHLPFAIYHLDRGFTMIELIVSIGILAILSVFLITTLNPYEQYLKSQDARRKSDLAQIQKALEVYYQDNGRYPYSTGGTGDATTRFRIIDAGGVTKNWGDSWTPYIQIIPKDTGKRTYFYVVSSTGQSYWLYASLQRGNKDPQSCFEKGTVQNDNETCTNVPVNRYCDLAIDIAKCNYGVSSSNESP